MEDFARACVLTAKSGSSKNEGTCCGILLDTTRGYILTHASLLAPFLLDKPQLLSQLDSSSKYGQKTIDINIEVVLEKFKMDIYEEKVSLTKYKSYLVNSTMQEKYPDQRIKSASLVSVFKCQAFEQTMKRLLPEDNWRFIDNNKDSVESKTQKPKDDQIIYEILPYFVLVKMNHWTSYDSYLSVRSSKYCHVGENVELLTTPFGNLFPEIMLNSVSKGIISNLSGRNNCLILADARCLPGSEGGPVFTVNPHDDSCRDLTGIVVSSMCWKSGEWLGFSLSCSIHEVLRSLPTSLQGVVTIERVDKPLSGSCKSIQATMPNVPLLKVGSTWGSGVILGHGDLVLTCSHVIKGFGNTSVMLKEKPHLTSMKCRVLHFSPIGVQFDLAVLTCPHLQSSKSCLPLAYPVEGAQVYVIGHSTFGEELNLWPSVTAGVVSKVVTVNNIPIMIQTTCAVHPGSSGGALVDTRGRLVGIVVSNAKDTDSGASFPHVNMSVPLVTVWPVISSYIKTKDPTVLKHLSLKNETIDRFWTLGKHASDKIPSHL